MRKVFLFTKQSDAKDYIRKCKEEIQRNAKECKGIQRNAKKFEGMQGKVKIYEEMQRNAK